MTEEKEAPKSPVTREPVVMPQALVTRDLEEKPVIDLKRRRL
jgi:hypothetical protein